MLSMTPCRATYPTSALTTRPPMSLPHESAIWTTEDELSYVRALHRDHKVLLLKVYVRWAHERRWYGPGMRVNAGMVILEARDLLEDLMKRGEA